jgi:hypothetical protein
LFYLICGGVASGGGLMTSRSWRARCSAEGRGSGSNRSRDGATASSLLNTAWHAWEGQSARSERVVGVGGPLAGFSTPPHQPDQPGRLRPAHLRRRRRRHRGTRPRPPALTPSHSRAPSPDASRASHGLLRSPFTITQRSRRGSQHELHALVEGNCSGSGTPSLGGWPTKLFSSRSPCRPCRRGPGPSPACRR